MFPLVNKPASQNSLESYNSETDTIQQNNSGMNLHKMHTIEEVKVAVETQLSINDKKKFKRPNPKD